jgi:hypothetical protein
MNRRTYLQHSGTAIVGSIGMSKIAMAQEGNETTTENEPEEKPLENFRYEISETCTLLGYKVEEIENSDEFKFAIKVESSVPKTWVISDALGILKSSGVTTIPTNEKTLSSGKHTLSLDVTPYQESAAITVNVPGGSIAISTGLPGDQGPQTSLTFGVLVGAGTALGAFGLNAYRENKKQTEDMEDIEEMESGGVL